MNEINEESLVGKKRVRRDRTEEILTEATKLFGKYGFRGTTLAMVAEAVELTEAGVLHYFPSKVHLLQGVLAYRDQKETEKYAKLIEAEKSDYSEFFHLLGDAYAQNEKSPELNRLFTVLMGESIRSDHPSHDFFVERFRRGRDIYTAQFSTQIRSKLHPDIDLDELAILIMAVMDGLQIQWLLDPENVNLIKTFNLFSKIMIDYLDE